MIGTFRYSLKTDLIFNLSQKKLRSNILNRSKIPPGVTFSNWEIESKLSVFESANDSATIQQFIEKNTIVSRGHLTPELQLRLVTKQCALWTATECLLQDPFWAFYWPGGQALTRFVLDNPAVVAGRSVLDVGSGCGASAIAAARSGSTSVCANDICPAAATAIKLNATLNDVSLKISTENLIGDRSADFFKVVLVGDMFYDDTFTSLLHKWMKHLHSKGADIYIGDPGRVQFLNHTIRNHLDEVERYSLLQDSRDENNGFTHGHVWKFREWCEL